MLKNPIIYIIQRKRRKVKRIFKKKKKQMCSIISGTGYKFTLQKKEGYVNMKTRYTVGYFIPNGYDLTVKI